MIINSELPTWQLEVAKLGDGEQKDYSEVAINCSGVDK
jgi:hypothetical protein